MNAPALPVVVEEPQEGEDDALSEDDDEDENDNAPADAEPAAPVPVAVVAPVDPFPYGNPAHESLQLSLEEAFFLMYGMGVLSVKDESGVAYSAKVTHAPLRFACRRS